MFAFCSCDDIILSDDFLNKEDGDNRAAGEIAGVFLTLELRGVISSKLSGVLLLGLGGVLVPLLCCSFSS